MRVQPMESKGRRSTRRYPWGDRVILRAVVSFQRLHLVNGRFPIRTRAEARHVPVLRHVAFIQRAGEIWEKVVRFRILGHTVRAIGSHGGLRWQAMAIVGGYRFNDVWNSSDGINWTQVAHPPPLGHRGMGRFLVVHQGNRLWLLRERNRW